MAKKKATKNRTKKEVVKKSSTKKKTDKKSLLIDELKSSVYDFKQLKTIHILLLEVLFWFLFIVTFMLGSYFIASQASLFENYQNVPADMKESMLSSFVGFAFVTLAMLSILVLIYWTATRYLIWVQLRNIKPKLRPYWKFLGVNVLWLIVLGIVFLLGAKILGYVQTAFYPNWAIYTIFIVMILVVVYLWFLTKLLFYIGAEGNKILRTFLKNLFNKEVFKQSLLTILVLIGVTLILSIFSLFLDWLWSVLGTVFDFIVTILLIIWVKYYLTRVFNRISIKNK